MSLHLEIVNLLRYQGAVAGVGCPAGDDELGAGDDTWHWSWHRGAKQGWRLPSGSATAQRALDEPAATGAKPWSQVSRARSGSARYKARYRPAYSLALEGPGPGLPCSSRARGRYWEG